MTPVEPAPGASMSSLGASQSFLQMTEPPKGPSGPFSRTALLIIVPIALISLVVAGVLTLVGGDVDVVRSAGPDAYSTSALGHMGLVDVLRKLDLPIIVSRSESATKAQPGVLVVAEPSAPDEGSVTRIQKLVAAAPIVLVVLPKWYGHTASPSDHWVDDVDLIPTDELADVLKALNLGGTIVRYPAPQGWSRGVGAPPNIKEPQLLDAEELEPVVASSGHILLGKRVTEGHELWVLTDPDVLNNFGLRDPDNARFTIQLLDTLRHKGPIVLDETTHGNAAPPSLSRVLFRFPLVLATMQVLMCAVLAMWAAAVRFGPKRAAPPPIAPGKDFLIRNTAALLRYGGHHKHALERYLAVAMRDVRHALHAPEARSAAQSIEWLERVRATRGGELSLVELHTDVESAPADKPDRLVELADRVYRWRQEMMHGSRNRT